MCGMVDVYDSLRNIVPRLDQLYRLVFWKSRCLSGDESITLHNDFTTVVGLLDER